MRPGIDYCLPLTGVAMLIKKHTGFSIEDLRTENRTRELTDARHLFCCLATEKSGKAAGLIGSFINRDRTSVLHAVKQVRTVPELQKKYKQIIEELGIRN